ncbi:MAG: hypothetical protein DI590_05675 [Methylorubrum populi]|nr:MAG: hypothetical protein DI590_05675 [Methylorubrum populi]
MLRRSVGHPDAPPATSFQLRYPLQIHAELMTHRVFSRNARSSRAVPTERMLTEVLQEPFIPRYWGANQKGMQAGVEHDAVLEYLLPEVLDDVSFDRTMFEKTWGYETDEHGTKSLDKLVWGGGDAECAWLSARDWAVHFARAFANAGYHKQIANRLLAPFLHIDVVLTTTDLSNWDALRDHDMAEPHIRDLAIAMKEAVAAYGEPSRLRPGEWHLPYFIPVEQKAIGLVGYVTDEDRKTRFIREGDEVLDTETARACSVTRCAQVSYTPFHEARLTVAEEVARHDALVSAQPMHASPAEHQATPDTRLPNGEWANPHLAGNLGPGWIQYRKTLSGERA